MKITVLLLAIIILGGVVSVNGYNTRADYSQDGISDLPILPSNSIFRYNISNSTEIPVHAMSNTWITAMNTRSAVVRPSSLISKYINYVDSSAPTYQFLFSGNHLWSDTDQQFPWLTDALYETLYDMSGYHYDRTNNIGYELTYVNADGHPGSLYPNGSHGTRLGNKIDYDNLSFHRPLDQPAGDVSGMPIIPLILSKADMNSPTPIGHALDLSVGTFGHYGGKLYIWPGSSSSDYAYNDSFPPVGAYLRLKSSFSTAGRSTNVTKIMNGLKTYGGVIHIRSGDDTMKFIGEVGSITSAERSEFQTALHLTDFEFVDISSLMISPTSYEVSGGGVTGESPGASFTQSKTILIRSGTIIVNDTSTNNPDTYTWDFGDDT